MNASKNLIRLCFASLIGCAFLLNVFCLEGLAKDASTASSRIVRLSKNGNSNVGEEGSETDGAAVLVVSPSIFVPSLQPWVEYREQQGYDVYLLPVVKQQNNGTVDLGIQTKPALSPEEIRNEIITFSQTHNLIALLLVGDGAPTDSAKFGWRDVVPAPRVPALAVQVFGSEKELATDSYYADLDGDSVPDVSVGRFPVETNAELQALIKKIINYETETSADDWMRRINVVAGPNGLDLNSIGSEPTSGTQNDVFGSGIASFVDSIVDRMARRLFSEFLPQEFALSLTQCSLSSFFCPYPPEFGEYFLERINEGSLFFIYMGHGRAFGLDRLIMGRDRDYGVFEFEDCSELNASKAPSIVLLLACYTGAYDIRYRCLAEEMVLQRKGPVAVFAGSRISAPYGLCSLGMALLETAFDEDYIDAESLDYTLGEIILKAKRRAIEEFVKSDEVEEEGEIEDEENFFDEEKDDIVQDQQLTVADEENNEISYDIPEENSDDDTLNGRIERNLNKVNGFLSKSLQKNAEMQNKKSVSFRETLNQAAKLLDPTASRLEDQVLDHIVQFNLFGDPLLIVKLPHRIAIDAPELTYSMESFPVSGRIPAADSKELDVRVELLLANFRPNMSKSKRPYKFVESEEARQDFNNTYLQANNFVVTSATTKTQNGGVFNVNIIPPKGFSGECVVRIASTDGASYYIGSKKILIRPSHQE